MCVCRGLTEEEEEEEHQSLSVGNNYRRQLPTTTTTSKHQQQRQQMQCLLLASNPLGTCTWWFSKERESKRERAPEVLQLHEEAGEKGQQWRNRSCTEDEEATVAYGRSERERLKLNQTKHTYRRCVLGNGTG